VARGRQAGTGMGARAMEPLGKWKAETRRAPYGSVHWAVLLIACHAAGRWWRGRGMTWVRPICRATRQRSTHCTPSSQSCGAAGGEAPGLRSSPTCAKPSDSTRAALTTNRSEGYEHCTSLNILTAGPTQFPDHSLPPLHPSHLPKCTNNAAEKWRPVCGAPSRQHTH